MCSQVWSCCFAQTLIVIYNFEHQLYLSIAQYISFTENQQKLFLERLGFKNKEGPSCQTVAPRSVSMAVELHFGSIIVP